MAISDETFKKEQSYLNKTIDVINEIIREYDFQNLEKMKYITEMKRYIWENNGELDDAEIASGMYNINNDVSNTNEKIKELIRFKKSLLTPYFGRVDFRNKPIYIGLNSVTKDFDFYVFDWRSPIASLFYNYGIGEASYEAPKGKISGEISLKRQYKIVDSKLERCFDSNMNIDDDYLQEILANSSSEKMTNIVNTIQAEQNEIIRNISDKYLIVQGIAGSGKTSVALHRIAYLLYAEKNLTSNNVLIFSPNEVFSEYISDVLPELGEENVLQTTFTDFSSTYMKKYKNIESFTEFIERYYKNEKVNYDEYNIIKYKLSDDFAQYVEQYIKNISNEIKFSKGITINSYTISGNELNNLLYNKFSRFPIVDRINKISEYICEKLNISYNKNGKTVTNKLLNSIDYDLDPEMIYTNIIRDKCDQTFSLSKKNLKYEDLLPLMYITFELKGYPRDNIIKHILIDEAQDYSLLQFEMLKKIFVNASFTILGDVNQTINPYYIYNNLNVVNSVFDNKGKYIELLKTYRSSEEIINYTNDILGIENVCAIRKNNNFPVIFKDSDKETVFNEIESDIKTMQENGMNRIAIIVKNNIEAVEMYNGLIEKNIQCSLITNEQRKSINDLVILPAYISKGLEFDAVISFSSDDNPYTQKDKYLFYVVCTRAQHCLTVYNQKKIITKGK